jgi:predicted membrane-bound spermidine synthase
VLASDLKVDWNSVQLHVPTQFLTNERLPTMTVFDPDTSEVTTDISTLENPAVLHYYLEGLGRWRG